MKKQTKKKRRPEPERRKGKHRTAASREAAAPKMEGKVGDVNADLLRLVDEQLEDMREQLAWVKDHLKPATPQYSSTAQWVEGEPPPRPAPYRFMGGQRPVLDGTLYANQPSDAEVYREYLKKHEHDPPRSVRPTEQR